MLQESEEPLAGGVVQDLVELAVAGGIPQNGVHLALGVYNVDFVPPFRVDPHANGVRTGLKLQSVCTKINTPAVNTNEDPVLVLSIHGPFAALPLHVAHKK